MAERKTLRDRLAELFRPAVYLGHNAVTLIGAVLTTSAGITLVVFWAFEILSSRPTHPYAGIVFFLVLPAVFVLGLILMPVGVVWRRARLRARGLLPEAYPRIDFRSPVLRNAAALVAGLTVINVAMMGIATYRGVEYMDSTQFCGLTCHTVMAPEYTAYRGSPHSRVSCVECHIGPGAPWFVKSKLSGVRQVFAVAFDTYSRPIPSPVEDLRPARETCEQCHWPQQFLGDRFLVRTHYAEDEANTALKTVLVLKLGGRTWQGLTGIHGRHLDTGERIRYVATDEHRQVIPQVTYLDDAGQTVEYVSTDAAPTAEQLGRGEHRAMDCLDCHNRPTHAFELPDRAVDQAISEGRVSATLPFVKKKAVEVLKADYPDRETAATAVPAALTDYYRSEYPEVYREHRALVETAANEVRDLYLRNVFPAMNVLWGTYPNNIGHQDFLGCFRCHDGSHESADGKTITGDCDACHNILAMEEENPKILQDLGIE
jgi:nitrate/TMAO reductase-like tetraheme cytochrome c subunit